jgi:hypothetical protein
VIETGRGIAIKKKIEIKRENVIEIRIRIVRIPAAAVVVLRKTKNEESEEVVEEVVPERSANEIKSNEIVHVSSTHNPSVTTHPVGTTAAVIMYFLLLIRKSLLVNTAVARRMY